MISGNVNQSESRILYLISPWPNSNCLCGLGTGPLERITVECDFFIFICLNREDRSSTGHILGQARLQQPNATPLRNLNPLSCSVLRCLTHVAMLLGTDQNMQVIRFFPIFS